MSIFQPATKSKSKLRLAIFGASGSGKTKSSLRIAMGIISRIGGKVAVIDTESGTASKYAGQDGIKFDTVNLAAPTIENYIKIIDAAAKEGYSVLIIDSLSHGWQELMDEVERLANSKYKGNSFRAWGEGTTKQHQLIKVIISTPIHIIATMRSKTEWVVEQNERNKAQPRKIGMAPEQGKGIEYEFDMLMELNEQHNALVSKDRTGRYQDQEIPLPDETFGAELIDWLNDGADMAVSEYNPPATVPNLANDKKRLSAMLKTKNLTQDMVEHYSELISVSTMPDELANIESKLTALPDKPDAVQLKKECAAILQKLIDAKIDGFDTETRRHNSFQKHLATDKLNDCTDAEKLTAYKAYLEDKLNSKPTIKQRQDALIEKLTAMPIMIEELQHWTEVTQSATRHAALDEVQAWIDKVEAK